MADRRVAVKFGTEGFAQAVQEIRKTAKEFDAALASAQRAVNQANRLIPVARGRGNEQAVAELDRRREQAIKQANQIIQNSYKIPGFRLFET